jgi:hypothetical protein
MEAVLAFIEEQDSPNRQIMQYLHDIITAVPDVTCKIRYQVPMYYRMSWICYFNPQKKGGVEWVLLRGNELSNAQGILEDRGRKQVKGVIFKQVSEIDEDMVREIFMEALILDEEKPYESKRKKK